MTTGERAFQPLEPAKRRAARRSIFALIGFLGLTALVPLAAPASTRAWFAMADAVIYPCLGVAAWLVWRRIDIGLARKQAALRSWGWLLLSSAFWPVSLGNLASPGVHLAIALVCLALAIRTLFAFRPLQPMAAVLLVPYTAWLGSVSSCAFEPGRFAV